MKTLISLFKDAFKEWGEDKASRLGAALAYYTIFSIGPLLVVIIAIAGRVFGEEAARGQIVGTISGSVGEAGAEMIQSMIRSANEPGAGIVASVLGGATLLLGAAGLFSQLKDALNTIWDVKPKPGMGIMGVIRNNFLSFTMVLGTGFMLLVSLVINAALAAVGKQLEDVLPGGPLVWQIVNYVVSLLVITLLFAMIFKLLPDVKMPWHNVWVGALITAVLLVLGQIALGFYFGLSNPGSAFGAAGSLVLILVWIYYSAQILFFGAELTQVYARAHGTPPVPADHATWISEDARARQGLSGGTARDKASRRASERAAESPWFK